MTFCSSLLYPTLVELLTWKMSRWNFSLAHIQRSHHHQQWLGRWAVLSNHSCRRQERLRVWNSKASKGEAGGLGGGGTSPAQVPLSLSWAPLLRRVMGNSFLRLRSWRPTNSQTLSTTDQRVASGGYESWPWKPQGLLQQDADSQSAWRTVTLRNSTLCSHLNWQLLTIHFLVPSLPIWSDYHKREFMATSQTHFLKVDDLGDFNCWWRPPLQIPPVCTEMWWWRSVPGASYKWTIGDTITNYSYEKEKMGDA